MSSDAEFAVSTRWFGALAAVLLALAAVVRLLDQRPTPIAAAAGETLPFGHGAFEERAYNADPSDLPPGIAARGSFIGGDGFQGSFVSGWFGRHSHVEMMVAGYPTGPGNLLEIDIKLQSGGSQQTVYTTANPGDAWRPWQVSLPTDAVAFRIVAVDNSAALRGWLAVSQPFRPDWRLSLTSQAVRSLLAFAVQGLLFATLALALQDSVRLRFGLASWLAPIGAAAAVAGLGYAAFWLYFASPIVGRIFSCTLLALAAGKLLTRKAAPGDTHKGSEWLGPFALAGIIGIGAIAFTCLYQGGSFSSIADDRFLAGMPTDNVIPGLLAERLWDGLPPKNFLGDWHASDRPPLQAGWLLLTRPIMAGLGFDTDTASTAGGICFQLLWVPALWALLRRMGARPAQSAAIIAAMSFTGFFLLFTIFTWPKMGAASLLLAAFVVWWTEPSEAGTGDATRFAFGGACAALGWLGHGGVAFSLIGLVPLILVVSRRKSRLRKPWLAAALAFAIMALPWFGFQKLYDPPGNRLLKWHLAGVIPVDDRSFGRALVENYRAVGWRGALANHLVNLKVQWEGDWRALFPFSPSLLIRETRWEQCECPSYAYGWWLVALAILPWAIWREGRTGKGVMGWAASWWLAGWAAWVLLMFMANQATIHQGSLVTQLLGFALLTWSALRCHRLIFLGCATLEAALFVCSWVPLPGTLSGHVDPLAAAISILSGLVLVDIIITGAFAAPGNIHETSLSPTAGRSGSITRVRRA